MQNESFRYLGILFLIAVVLYLTNLSGPVLWDVDEARFASCAAELYNTGNWTVPRLNGEVYGTKPIMMFWFMMCSYFFFGINEFAARLPSVLFSFGSLYLTYQIGMFFFDRKVGFWAAITLACSLLFSLEARGATPDAALTFAVCASLYVWLRGTYRSKKIKIETEASPALTLGADSAPTSEFVKILNENGDSVVLQKGNIEKSIASASPPTEPELLENDENEELQLRVAGAYYPQERWRVFLIYLVMGFGVLIKGPLACVVPTAVLGMFLLAKRQPSPDPEKVPEPRSWYESLGRGIYLVLRPFSPAHFWDTILYMRPLMALAAIAVVALPWYFLVTWKTGIFSQNGYLYQFIYVNNFQRALTPFDGHGGTIFYHPLVFYPVSLLVGFFPWSLFTIPAVLECIKQYRAKAHWRDGFLFVLCWGVVWIGCFSVCATKLPSYIVPMYPAFALVVGVFVRDWMSEKPLVPNRWLKIAFAVGLLVGATFAVLGAFAVLWMLSPLEIFVPITLGGIIVLGCASCVISNRSEKPIFTIMNFTLVAIFFTFFLHCVAAPRVAAYHPARAIGKAVKERQLEAFYEHKADQKLAEILQKRGSSVAASDPQLHEPIRVVTYRCFRQSWVFYAERPFERFEGEMPEFSDMVQKTQPEIVIAPKKILEKQNEEEPFMVPENYSVRTFYDFNLPKRTPLMMLVRN